MIEFDFQMLIVLGLIALTIGLFVSEIVSIDVAALCVLILLGLTSLVPGLQNLIAPPDLFVGFASNAVVSIMAIMIIGDSLDRVGVMRSLANGIARFGGRTETRVTSLVCSSVAVISSFMQNVGAAALYIPVVSRLSMQLEIPITRLLMPMGFCAIMGGTLTMVGSSPLILLNDLTRQINQNLPDDNQIAQLGLFAVTPIGLCLVGAGLIYFLTFGRVLLPKTTREHEFGDTRASDRIKNAYLLNPEVFVLTVPQDHVLVGKAVGDIEDSEHIHIVAIRDAARVNLAPVRDVGIPAQAALCVVAPGERLEAFSARHGLSFMRAKDYRHELIRDDTAGFSEVVIPAESTLVGKSIADIWLRRSYQLAGLGIHRGNEVFNDQIRHLVLQAGDTLLTFGRHDAFAALQKNRDFIPITPSRETEADLSHKAPVALLFLAIALGLVLFSNMMLSLCLWVGAIGMILFRIITIEQCYAAISWKTIFLLACLMPLGRVVETSGTAAWIAQNMAMYFGDADIVVMQLVLALLATFFTLVMSNVGATVLLVPLAVNLAITIGADPLVFALIIAISTSNSFLIPTHQVNVLIMSPGGYRVVDFIRTGGLLTVIFIAVELTALNLFY